MKLPEIIISVKLKGALFTELERVTTSGQIYSLLTMMFDSNTVIWTEEMIIVCLNQFNAVIGWKRVSSGGFAGTVLDTKVIATIALQTGATSIILSHNHPSGNIQPSKEDISLTKKICEGLKLLDIKLLDHIIYSPDKYFSMADEGIFN